MKNSIAIIEHKCFSEKNALILKKKIAKKNCELIGCEIFETHDEFWEGLQKILKILLLRDDEEAKLLILSTHGIERTGTDLFSIDKNISLLKDNKLFSVLPPNLVIYLSVCFGAYPNACSIQTQSKTSKPFILGPLVNIKIEDANNFQTKLIDLISLNDIKKESLIKIISEFNQEKMCEYENRYAFGLIDQNGEQYPTEAVGTQLAAKAETSKEFIVLETNPNHIILKDDNNQIYLGTSTSDSVLRKIKGLEKNSRIK